MSIFSFELIPGTWYVFITYKECDTRHALFPDISPSKSILNGTYRRSCPKCGRHDDYRSEELERCQYNVKTPAADATTTAS